MWKKLAKIIGYFLFLCFSVLLLLEGSFRWYIVDFYRNNLIGLNASKELQAEGKPTILVIGDSFSADQNSYVKSLRDSLADYRVINSAVPGTCIRQHALLMSSRLKEFQPDILIYQIYVGNDLLEFRHPTESSNISLARRCYWWMADRFLVLGFINSKLPYLKHWLANDLSTGSEPKLRETFAPELYNSRTKMLFKAEPELIENSVLLQVSRKNDFQAYIHQLQTLIQMPKENCRVLLLVIPHCMQLNKRYQDRMELVGASLTNPDELLAKNYPFIQSLEQDLPQQQVQIINPLPLLQEKDTIESVYYENDPHLTTYGQEMVGKLVLSTLTATIQKKEAN